MDDVDVSEQQLPRDPSCVRINCDAHWGRHEVRAKTPRSHIRKVSLDRTESLCIKDTLWPASKHALLHVLVE